MMRYDLFSLRLFLGVASKKSIASAAEAQNIATSAVSKRISDLEKIVDAPLFYRRQRGVELTPAGEELLRYAVSICRMVDKMDADMGDFAEGLRGHIRVAANTSAITQFLPEDLAEFVQQQPALRIELNEQTSDQIISTVRDGFADIGVFSGLLSVDDLDVMDYRTDTLVVIAPEGHPIASVELIKFEQVLDFNFVGLQQGSSIQAFLENEATGLNRELNTQVEVMSFDGVRRMVQAGLGIAILPFGAAEPYLESTELSLVHIDEPWAIRSLKLVVRDKATLTRPTCALIDHLTGETRDIH